jgi:hypothetical protein
MLMEAIWPDRPDSLDEDIEKALGGGWLVIPQVGHGCCDNALVRLDAERGRAQRHVRADNLPHRLRHHSQRLASQRHPA